MTTVVATVAGIAAAVAAVWPYIPAVKVSAGLTPSERAAWVNRLFLLVEAAEKAGEEQVVANGRALISSLVVPQDTSTKARR